MFIAIISDWTVIETLLAIAIILILIDIFIPTEILTHIGIILLCVAFYRILDIKILWRVAASIAMWFVFVAIYYALWKQIIGKVTNKFIAPTKHHNVQERLVGAEGLIEEIEGRLMCRVKDEIWPFEDEGFAKSDMVQVIEVSEGKLKLEKK